MAPYVAARKGRAIRNGKRPKRKIIRPARNRPGALLPFLVVILGSLVSAACNYTQPSSPNPMRASPLHVAAKNGDLPLAEELIAEGADVNAADLFNRTPLDYAATNGHAQMTKLLIARGAHVNGANIPLSEAISEGHQAIVEILLAKGADVNARDLRRRTPLHLAALRNETSIALRLLERGADVNAKMETGDTPLHIAALNNNRPLCEKLVHLKADVRAVNGSGKTPLARAEENHETYKEQAARTGRVLLPSSDYSSVIELLRKHGGKHR